MLAKKRFFLVTALVYILYIIFPLFADLIRIPVWLPSIAVFGIILFLYPKAFANKTFYWFLVYALVLFLYLLVGKPLTIGIGSVADSKKILIEYAFILPSLSIFCVLLFLKDVDLTRKLVLWSTLLLYASFIVAIPLMMQYNSIREALSMKDETMSVPGLPGYTLMHAYTVFLPVVCYAVKTMKLRARLFAILGLAMLCFVIYDTFVTTSLVLMIVVVLFTFFYTDNSSIVIFAIVGVLLFILYKAGFFISLIDWIMPVFEDTPVAYKLNDFSDSMKAGHITGGSITGRMDHHDISRQSFYANPVFGGSKSGGHSSILDRLGGMGMVGALPFIMILLSVILQTRKLYSSKKAKVFYYVGIAVSIVFLYNKGLFGSEGWLMYMVLMPMGIYVVEKKTINDRI